MSSNGIKTSYWGPCAWAFLFSTIAGSYPVRVDKSDKDHMKSVKAFQAMFANLDQILPCCYCRESYKRFYKDLPIANYSSGRRQMMKWLYLIHDRVNQKLILQEQEIYEIKKKELARKNLSSVRMKSEMKALRSSILKTKPSPAFDKIVSMYEKQRA